MITMSFDGTDVRVIETLQRAGPGVLAALVRAIEFLDLDFQRYVVTQKLQGQVLHHRSGKLASSVRVLPVTQQGAFVSGGVSAGGGVAWYGRLHEFGGRAAYEIRPRNAKALRFEIGGSVVFRRRVLHPPALERSFMRSSIEEKRNFIAEKLREAVVEGLAGS